MDTFRGESRSAEPAEAYVTPELVVHGSVKELTQGSTVGSPDIGAQGSSLV